MKLTPEALEKLHGRQLANIVRKLQDGKTLTAREEAHLLQAGEGEGPLAKSGYAKTWDELATACGVDRRTLTNVRQQHGKACPADRADGRKPIAEWIRFLAELDVKGRGVNDPNYIDERQLKLEERKEKLELARFQRQKAQEALLPVAEYEAGLQVMVSQFRQVALALPGRAAGKILSRARAALLRMLQESLPPKTWEKVEQIVQTAPIDFADIEEELAEEVGHLIRSLNACDYLDVDEGAE